MCKCKNCNEKEATKYSKYTSGEFCSKRCSMSFSTKLNRVEINIKVSKKLLRYEKIILNCENCDKKFEVIHNKRGQKFCSRKCSLERRWENPEYREYMTEIVKNRCKDEVERERLEKIGRKGGFGKKGHTLYGTKYQSDIERVCFEYLELNKIEFENHKRIPNSSKISDIYLTNIDTWVEIDGIDREKRKKWLGKNYDYWIEKLSIYKKQNLNYKVIKNLEELKKIVDYLI